VSTPEDGHALLIAIGQRLEREQPSWSGERIHAAAKALAASGAYELVYGGLRATSIPAALQAAWRACPEFAHSVATQGSQGLTAAQRTLAELSARGLSLDDDPDDDDIPLQRGPDGSWRIVGFTPPGGDAA
jgi:hypothetical protein